MSERAKLSDGTTWPIPGDELREVEWQLRYRSTPVEAITRLSAASIVAAYSALIVATRRQRDRIVRDIRREMDLHRSEHEAAPDPLHGTLPELKP